MFGYEEAITAEPGDHLQLGDSTFEITNVEVNDVDGIVKIELTVIDDVEPLLNGINMIVTRQKIDWESLTKEEA